MKKALRVLLPLLLLALLLFARLPARTAEDPAPQQAQNVVTDTLTLAPETAEDAPPAEEAAVDEDGSYTTAEDVALYIHPMGSASCSRIVHSSPHPQLIADIEEYYSCQWGEIAYERRILQQKNKARIIG